MSFIMQSTKLFVEKTQQQLRIRQELFNENKTPKRVFSFWFFIFLLGQIGIVTSVAWVGLSGGDLLEALSRQGKSGNFLTFEISLILSCLVYYFEEYGEEPVKNLFFLRVTLLIFAMIVAFLAMLNYIYINSVNTQYCWPDWFVNYNIGLYVFGVLLSYWMYSTFSVVEMTAASYMRGRTDSVLATANDLQSMETGKIGNKTLNLEGGNDD